MSIDNEEFYEQQRPLSLPDIVQLVFVLKEVSAVCQSWDGFDVFFNPDGFSDI
jgi:hypothetical protein